jgi:A/G-specific adenine glycosylase
VVRVATSQLRKVSAIAASLLKWYPKNARDLPWRRTTDPYAIWVSEIMLQQTQVKTVLGYWERWMEALRTIEALAKAGPARIHKLWEGLGYYTRVRNMQKAARQIVSQHDGKFPRDYDAILELPGIGRYTAGAIASIAFNEPRPILDGNVMRVLARVFGVDGNVREKPVNDQLWRLSEELVLEAAKKRPGRVTRLNGCNVATEKATSEADQACNGGADHCSHLNQSLMELGALICTPKQPKCAICPARKFCVALATGKIAELPNLGKRVASTQRYFVAFVLEDRGRYLVRQRPAGVVNAHLWEFPNVEIELGGAGETSQRRLASAATGLGLEPARLEPLCTIKHTITRYRITLEAYRGEPGADAAKLVEGGRWLKPVELRKLAFTSAHRRVLEKINAMG